MSLFLLPIYYLILIIIILIIFYNFYWKRRNLPDGPIPLPIIGNVIEISKADRRYKCFEDWTKKYGPVYTIWVGEQPIVIVTDYELIKSTFIRDGDSYVDRDFLTKHFTIYFGSVDGVIRSNGEQWKQLRKFFFKAMRDYGIDKDTVEKQVLDAIFRVIDKTKKEKQEGKKEHSIDRQVDLMTGSIINQIMLGFSFYGERYKEFFELKKLLDIQQFMVIRHIPIYVKQFYNEGKWATKKIFEYSKIEIDKRIEKRKNPNYVAEEGMDVLDQFLESVEETDQNDPNNYYKINYLTAFVYDMFLAGQETTSNTINFMILYLMLDQNSQNKLQKELDQVMEEKRNLAKETGEEFNEVFYQSDRLKLNYTNAVTNETQRLSNLLPLNLTRKVNKDVKIGGHNIKSGTILIPQISTVLFNEKIFPEPEKFIPERFLDENGQFKRIEENIPFGVGKRICVGEALAKMELFLFAANFFYKFHVYPPNPLNPPKHEKRQTFAVKLEDYNCCVELRN
ncbi:hypothetical protein Mgra_00006289 [Meloidogyne graminicola]|uniref:Cytochrome P450 n=1 Tax=Meloidogyne graminicola TaxID=189291 RepID=A0A8S9ZM26_9BILA|nr:hypothetical protein Mgra_00006289 [Meloidogyne graminicola]